MCKFHKSMDRKQYRVTAAVVQQQSIQLICGKLECHTPAVHSHIRAQQHFTFLYFANISLLDFVFSVKQINQFLSVYFYTSFCKIEIISVHFTLLFFSSYYISYCKIRYFLQKTIFEMLFQDSYWCKLYRNSALYTNF